MATFNDFRKLEQFIKMQVGQAVKSVAVEDVFADAMTEAVEDIVYDVYEPVEYERREGNGGLSDYRNMEFTSVKLSGNTFESDFENLTVGQDSMDGKYISELIENGRTDGTNNGEWDKLGAWSEPRPFARETAIKLNNGSHNARLKRVLEKEINR